MYEKSESPEERVVLVDENDSELGSMAKLEAHCSGSLHRAFSVFLFNDEGMLLLQKRADVKYHSAGLWSNTCCGHPRPGETTVLAAQRRLYEEMGLKVTLREAGSFIYRADLGNGLSEHELDHILIGSVDRDPEPNAEEASDWRWVGREAIAAELGSSPERFTAWFPLCVWDAWDHSRSLQLH